MSLRRELHKLILGGEIGAQLRAAADGAPRRVLGAAEGAAPEPVLLDDEENVLVTVTEEGGQ